MNTKHCKTTEKDNLEENVASHRQEDTPPDTLEDVDVLDGGYGWVVVAASFCNCAIVGGHFSCFGLLYPSISAYYDVPFGVSGWVGSLCQAVMHIFAFVYSTVVNKFGCRPCSVLGSLLVFIGYVCSALTTNVYQLYLTFGVITGIGGGLIFLSNIVIVQRYFKKRRALAAGLSNSGLSFGIIGLSLLVEYFISEYQWKGAMLLLGAMFLNGVVFGYFLIPLEHRHGITNKAANTLNEHDKITLGIHQNIGILTKAKSLFLDVFDFSLLKVPVFLAFGVATFCNIFGMVTFYMHTPNRALHLGIQPDLIGWLPATTAISTFVFRVSCSFVANYACANRVVFYGAGTMLGGGLMFIYCFCTSFATILLVCAGTGAGVAISQTVQPTLLVDLLGIQHIAKAQALVSLFMGTGALVSAPLAGYLYDIYEDYSVPFFVSGGIQTFGAILSLFIYCFHRQNGQ